MLDLSAKPVENDNDLIPKDQLLFVVMKLREIKTSDKTGTRYLDMELTVDEGQKYAKRKLWINIMDPLAAHNSEGAKNMGLGQLRRILETAIGATPDNPQSYKQLTDYQQLTGLRVPVKISVETEKDPRYDDKNGVEFLSPHSSVKSVVKAYDALVHEGVSNLSELAENQASGAAAPAPGGFPPAAGQPPVQQQPPAAPVGQNPAATPPQSQAWVNPNPQAGVPPAQPADTEDEIPF